MAHNDDLSSVVCLSDDILLLWMETRLFRDLCVCVSEIVLVRACAPEDHRLRLR